VLIEFGMLLSTVPSAEQDMLKRRLDDRIREFCTQVSASPTEHAGRTSEIDAPLQGLLDAIHEKVIRLRTLAAQKLLAGNGLGEAQKERRIDHL
jgi:hypothetical protein